MDESFAVIKPASLVMYEDEDVLVINKPAGISMHKTAADDPNVTIHDLYANKLAQNDPIRGGIVHRLDKDTSGVVIMAKNNQAMEFLQKQFAARKVEKDYLALVWGHLKHAKARIELPIRRSTKAPNQVSIHQSGKMSISEYRIEHEYDQYSLVQIQLQTGRMHQIRVQFAHIGHPVVGDKMYGNKPLPAGLGRQFLHAKRLGLMLPGTTTKRFFEAPLAEDLKQFLETING